ncbi:MAG: PIN domain-containing protein [Candidatus Thermoplasmatota archaeon]
MAVLDTNFLIALERQDPKAIAKVDDLVKSAAHLRIPAAAWVEYLSGVSSKRRHAAQADLDETCVFEPFTRDQAIIAVRLQLDLMERGARMSWNDLQIAAAALHFDEQVVSRDAAFDDVTGLVRVAF